MNEIKDLITYLKPSKNIWMLCFCAVMPWIVITISMIVLGYPIFAIPSAVMAMIAIMIPLTGWFKAEFIAMNLWQNSKDKVIEDFKNGEVITTSKGEYTVGKYYAYKKNSAKVISADKFNISK